MIFAIDTLRAARRSATESGRSMLEVLEDNGGADPGELLHALSACSGYPLLSLHELHSLEPAFDQIPFAEAQRRRCVAVRSAGQAGVVVALSDPFDDDLAAWIEEQVVLEYTRAVVHRADIETFLGQHETSVRAMDLELAGAPDAEQADRIAEVLSLETIGDAQSQVVRLVNSTLYDALKTGVSDIHLESVAAGLAIKYRLDGVLTSAGSVSSSQFAEQMISRIKILAELDIAERRVPQDGRIRVSHKDRDIDIRVSVMPSLHGEDAVLRILDKRALAEQARELRLEHLGLDARTLPALRRLAREPHGMLLVTGPTGSGKTTSLYAVIGETNTGADKIITIEDPIEYQLPGVLQIPVNEKKGLTFARGLRSILRHDPDRIMVGEIRDSETAEIAIQAALTGHLVYTTVHANNVFDVIGRFVHMGVDAYSFVSALNGVLAQRLIRVNCAACAEDYRPEATLLAESRISATKAGEFRFRRGIGCAQCRGSGFRGRRAIGELLVLDDPVRELIAAKAAFRQLKEAAAAAGLVTLRQAALDLVRAGITSLEAANHATSVE